MESIYSKLKTSDCKEMLLKRQFPVIIEKDNPSNGQLLIFSEDFEEFGLAYPDSLKWTDKLKKK